MNKQETYDYLTKHGIKFEKTEHRAVFSMNEVDAVELPYPDRDAKNLFVRDNKKRNYYLITVMGDKRVNLKEFRKAHGLRSLSFASADELMDILNLTPGSVTPLGLINDAEHKVKFYIDAAFKEGLMGIHPNDNTATVWINAEDLVRLISDLGNDVEYAEL